MMRTVIDPFTVNLPHLDLHGENSDSAKFEINTFINDNYIMKKERVVIIHGKGQGILKKVTQEELKKSKKVFKYWIDSNNDGQTIVELIKNTN